jgi:hypothetical protein
MESIQVASPICADDIALLGEWTDIQAMLNVIEHHTKRDMVKINPDKSEVILLWHVAQNLTMHKWFDGQF